LAGLRERRKHWGIEHAKSIVCKQHELNHHLQDFWSNWCAPVYTNLVTRQQQWNNGKGWILMSIQIIYGLGGYDPSKPNNNIIAEIELENEEQNG
jgi:hypothetical protein